MEALRCVWGAGHPEVLGGCTSSPRQPSGAAVLVRDSAGFKLKGGKKTDLEALWIVKGVGARLKIPLGGGLRGVSRGNPAAAGGGT